MGDVSAISSAIWQRDPKPSGLLLLMGLMLRLVLPIGAEVVPGRGI